MAVALQANGVTAARRRTRSRHLPPVGSLFAAFLGYNPMQQLLGSPHAAGVRRRSSNTITGKSFFPHLISAPFMTGLRIAFTASMIMCLVAAAASWMRGKSTSTVTTRTSGRQRGDAAPLAEVVGV